ncbi:hypothetical protein MRX96_025554 [Rhipicephalus microplus]
MEMPTSDIVEVHLLELPDVVQDTIPTCKSTERDRADAWDCLPKRRDSPPGAERGGLKRRPSTSVAKEGQQKAPGVFMSEDLYFNPPKKLNYMPGYSFKRVKLLVDDLPAANTEGGSSNISVAAAMTTMTEAEIAGCGVSTKRPAPPDVRAASTQTLPSLGKGSLMTFMSTTNGTVAMTQVSHRRQADKGSGTGTQDSGTQPSVVNPEGDSRMVRSLEHLRPRRKAKIRKVSGARRSNAVPSPQLPLATKPADSLTSAQSSGFALTLVKQEVSSDIEAEDIELTPDGGDEQTFQPPSPRSVNQWDDVTVKTEPPSP